MSLASKSENEFFDTVPISAHNLTPGEASSRLHNKNVQYIKFKQQSPAGKDKGGKAVSKERALNGMDILEEDPLMTSAEREEYVLRSF